LGLVSRASPVHTAVRNCTRDEGRPFEFGNQVLDTGDGSSLQRLALMVQLYDQFQTDETATLVDRAIDDLSSSTIDGDEANEARYMLEQLILTLLPMQLADKAREVVTAAIARMLEDYGAALTLDDMKSVAKHLCEYGSDKDAAAKASAAALEGYLTNLDTVLYDLSSVEELEKFEREVTSAMKDYRVTNGMFAFHVETRRDELLSEESRDNNTGYKWTPKASPGDMSDNDIRSLFRALREE